MYKKPFSRKLGLFAGFVFILITISAAFIALALALSGKPSSNNADILPTLAPPTSRDLIQDVSPDTSKIVMDTAGWSIAGIEIREARVKGGSSISYLNVLAVSTGEFDEQEFPIADGKVIVDVVYAYVPTKTGVVSMPIPVGFQAGEKYNSVYGNQIGETDRASFLEDTRNMLPKGQTFGLMIINVSYSSGVDRSHCEKTDLPIWCQIAQTYNDQHQSAEAMFISKNIIDRTWMPVGWTFFLFPVEDPKYSQVISLP